MTKSEKLHTARNWGAAILFCSGMALGLAAAGTEDRRDAIENENRLAGYERYSTEDMASSKTTNKMIAASMLSLAGAAFLLLRNQKQR